MGGVLAQSSCVPLEKSLNLPEAWFPPQKICKVFVKINWDNLHKPVITVYVFSK